MVRKRKQEEPMSNNVPVAEPVGETVPAQVVEEQPAVQPELPRTNGKTRPAVAFKYAASKDVYVEVAVWSKEIVFDGKTIVVFNATIQRSYRDAQGVWATGGSWRGSEIPVLQHALTRAHQWMLDQRECSSPF